MAIYSKHQLKPTEAPQKNDRIMPENDFDEVIKAILNGKYSWACVLILRASGYNPLHYIPYRTYKRLLKENSKNAKTVSDLYVVSDDLECQRYQNIKIENNQESKISIPR